MERVELWAVSRRDSGRKWPERKLGRPHRASVPRWIVGKVGWEVTGWSRGGCDMIWFTSEEFLWLLKGGCNL